MYHYSDPSEGQHVRFETPFGLGERTFQNEHAERTKEDRTRV